MNLLIPLLGVMFNLHRLTAGLLFNETMIRMPSKQTHPLPLSHPLPLADPLPLSLNHHNNYTIYKLKQNENHINHLNNSNSSYNTNNTSINNNNTSISILTLPHTSNNIKNNNNLAKVMPEKTDSNLMMKDDNWLRKKGTQYSLGNKNSADYSINNSTTNSTESDTKNDTVSIRKTSSDKRIEESPKIISRKSPNNSITKSYNNSIKNTPNNRIISAISPENLSPLPHQISPHPVKVKHTTTRQVISSHQTPRGSHQRSGHGQMPKDQLTALKSSEILRRYNLSVQAGELVFLSCEVPHFLDQNVQVSWVRRNDWHILSSGLQLYTRERRFEIHHDEENDEWILLLRYANVNDSGTYDCQMVDSTKSLSHLVDLTVTSATATIIGDGEYHVDEGSTISLVCHINYTNSAPDYVFWYHNNRMISFDRQRGGINVTIEVTSHVTSHLRISRANQKDSGNYTCMATNTEPDSITVYITDVIEGAAVQGRGSSTSVVQKTKCKQLIIWTISTLLLLKI